MDLEVARKALSKRSKFSSKRVAFFVVAGLCLVAGILSCAQVNTLPSRKWNENTGCGCTIPTARRRHARRGNN